MTRLSERTTYAEPANSGMRKGRVRGSSERVSREDPTQPTHISSQTGHRLILWCVFCSICTQHLT